jgi:spore coat protein CotH
MTLNAMTQDTSKLHEFGAYALFNAMNIPASKTGWAKVMVNGVSKGLYVNIEQPDQIFMAKRFRDITQHVYEGIAMKDFKLGHDDGAEQSGAFLADYGWKVTPNKFDLGELIDAATETDQAIWYERMNEYFNRDSLITFFAVESFLGHWDGYSGPDINNYYLRSSTNNKFTFVPWGVDQTFGENRQTD